MLCVHYSIMFALLETGQSTTLHVEQLSSYIPLKLVQEDKTSHSCCWICKRKAVFMHVCCMPMLRIISCYIFFCQSDLSRGFFQLKPTFSPSSLITSSHTWLGKSKILKLKIILGADWYDLQLKQTVYQLTLPKLPILKSLLEHHSVHLLWWILHAYIYMSDPVEILDVSSLKAQISI